MFLCGLISPLQAVKGPTGYPNNAVFVHEFVSNLLSESFPNLRPAQLQVSLPPVCFQSCSCSC